MPIHRPTQIPDHATVSLEALAGQGLGHKITLGGAFGLLHYLDYRETNDVDAWWAETTSTHEKDQIVEVVRDVLAKAGEVRVRQWGDVVSIELLQDSRKVFSFQIASRSARLGTPQLAPWTDVLLDSFQDLIASKMVALVERGAPRDFRDIHAVCQNQLCTAVECWELWRQRQQRAGGSTDSDRARLAVRTHLGRIAAQRPLASIEDPEERAAAARVRTWFEKEFLDALVD
jgi:hypothetical protein